MRIVDLHHYRGAHLYCGRPMPGRPGSILANPFTPKLHGADCIRFYAEWLAARVAETHPPVLAALAAVRDHTVLGCWCADLEGDRVYQPPYLCHTQIIARVAARLLGKQVPE